MKIGLISSFVFLSPFFAARINDGFSIGLLDILAPILIVLVISRISLVLQSGIGLFFLTLSITLMVSFLFSSMAAGASGRDLAFVRMIYIFLPTMLLLTQPMTEDRVVRLTTLFCWGGGIAIVVGIVLFHLDVQIRSNQQALWTGDGTGPNLRAGGILGNSSDFSHLTAVWGSVCGLTTLVFSHRRRRYLLAAIIFLISLYATWIASSRAATLHLLLAYGVALPFILGRGVWALTGCIAVLVVLVAPFILSDFSLILPQQVTYNLQRLDILNLSGSSTFLQTGRFLNWAVLLEVYKDNWLLGIGYKNINDTYGIWGDNAYLTTFVEFGLIAGTVYALFWIWLVALSAKAAFETKFGIVFFALVVSEFLHGFTVDTGTIWYSMPLAWLFIAAYYLLCATRQRPAPSGLHIGMNGQKQFSNI